MNLASAVAPEDRSTVLHVPREDNKLRLEDRAAHDWYRFVLSFPAHLVRTYVERFRLVPSQTVLDPFCGTGTTLVECKKLGIPSCGIEPNPMAALASRTKTDWEIDPEVLVTHATNVAKVAMGKLASDGLQDEGALPLFEPREKPHLQLRTLHEQAARLLLTDSSSRVLNKPCFGKSTLKYLRKLACF